MIQFVKEMLSYPFMARALVAGTLVALCSALLGVSLVLKRFSMIGDGLSHVAFGALAMASVTNAAPLAMAVPFTVVAAFLLLRLSEQGGLRGDALIALVSSTALALGVAAVSLSEGMNTDVNNYLFGSILGMTGGDVALSVGLSLMVLTLFTLFYNQIFAVTFDEAFAQATGTNVKAYNALIALLAALVVVVGMRLMGALLISSLIVFPPLTSMRVHTSFKRVVISSAVVSVACLWAGVAISFAFSTPTGASVVICNAVAFLAHCTIGYLGARVRKD